MESELLRCPFCGGEAIIFQIPYNTEAELKMHQRWLWNEPGLFTVGCQTEQCIANFNNCMMLFYNSKQAIEAWNRRAENQEDEDDGK